MKLNILLNWLLLKKMLKPNRVNETKCLMAHSKVVKTELFFESDERSNGFIKPYFGQSDRCAVEYDDLWVCRGVQVNPTPSTVQECKKNWGKNQGCRSCKAKIKNAKGFYFEVLNKDGHLDYRNMYWIDTWGGYHKMDAQKNC